MKKIFTLLSASFIMNLTAQLPSINYAISAGGTGMDVSNAITTDVSNGNSFITGKFESTVDFEPSAITQNLVSFGQADVFVAKYTTAGTYAWAFNIGGTSNDEGTGISLDNNGNVLVAGTFEGTIDVDHSNATANLLSNGAVDIFVAKYNATNATYQWAFNLGGGNIDRVSSICSDALGNCFITGFINGTVDFDPSSSVYNLTSNMADIFVAKYDPNGALLWAFILGDSDTDLGKNLKCDNAGNLFVTGIFTGNVDFDPSAGTNLLTSSGATISDGFVAKYNPNGILLWVIGIPTSNFVSPVSLAIDPSGNCIISGVFGGAMDFDLTSSAGNVTAPASQDLFVAKYSGSGAYQWSFNTNSSSGGAGYGISILPSGDFYLTGYVMGTADFDPSAGVFNLTTSGQDIFLAKYTSACALKWAFSVGGMYSDIAYGVTCRGNVAYLTGSFSHTVDFDPAASTNTLMVYNGPNGPPDIFVAKYEDCLNPLPPSVTNTPSLLTICANSSASLHAFPFGPGYIDWYDSPNSTNLLWPGEHYLTPTLSPGTYTYYAVETSSCNVNPNVSAVTVTVHPLPSLLASAQPTSICISESALLMAGATSIISYSWSNSASTFSTMVSPNTNTTYSVTVIDNHNCSSSGQVSVSVNECTGFKNYENTSHINVFPNPGNGNVTLQINLEKEADLKISIVDINGKEIYASDIKKVKNQTEQLDLSSFSNGIYFMKLSGDLKELNEKIIIQR